MLLKIAWPTLTLPCWTLDVVLLVVYPQQLRGEGWASSFRGLIRQIRMIVKFVQTQARTTLE